LYTKTCSFNGLTIVASLKSLSVVTNVGLFLINATLVLSETFQSDCVFAVVHAELAVLYAALAVANALLAIERAKLSVPAFSPVINVFA